MKKLLILLLSLTITAATSVTLDPILALASDYTFGTGADTLGEFGGSTSYDGFVTPDPMSQNARRNKDAAYFAPPYGVFSGDIPTDPSSPYHDNLPDSGSVPDRQIVTAPLIVSGDSPPPGSSTVSTDIPNALLPSTSQTYSLNTEPWYYEDGSIGTLYVERTKKTIKVYEGEDLSNLKIGAGHFSATSAWDGNVGLAGHNRGGAAYFSFIKDLQDGDRLTYTTKYGVRTYEVYSKTRIDEYNNLPLSWSDGNILTLITCVADVPELRYCAVAREIK
jgi:sortase A